MLNVLLKNDNFGAWWPKRGGCSVTSCSSTPTQPTNPAQSQLKKKKIGLCRSLWIYNADNTLARRGINICPIKTAIMLKQNSASHVGSTQYAFLVRYVYPYASHITKEFISKMYFVNCGIILVPKFCIFSRQCEHNTNVGTDALRNWDQYKSQMYYINSGFILVPKFCSMQMRSWNELQYGCIFFVSRNKYTQILSWHALGPI